MDRAEAAGFGIATIGHLALLAALSLGFAATRMPVPRSDPIEVSFVDEVGLESTAPTPTTEAPAPMQGPEDAPPAPVSPTAPAVEPVPAPKAIQPAPAPVPTAAKPKPNAAPPRPAPVAKPVPPRPAPAVSRPGGRLSGLLNGVSDRDSDSPPAATPAASAGPAVQASLVAEVRRQLKPHWKAPTGADAEQLRTEVVISLGPDGQVTDIRIVGTTGQTASNRPQVPLHQEQAQRAVRLASPFRLPAQYYEAWKQLRITFDKRL
ncbi:MAG: TonB C-terminal domain-containing protein [Allosphingosinicella sp.]